MSKRKENVSTVMLLPVIKINKKLIDNFYKFGFKNTYLYSNQLSEYKFGNYLYILFEPEKLDNEFNDFILSLSENDNYIETIDVGYKKVLVTFKIPNQFKRDFQLFLKGLYSKLSMEYKKCFQLEKPVKNERGDVVREINGGIKKEPTIFAHIFNRSKILQDKYKEKLGLDNLPEGLELYDRHDPVKETLFNLILV